MTNFKGFREFMVCKYLRRPHLLPVAVGILEMDLHKDVWTPLSALMWHRIPMSWCVPNTVFAIGPGRSLAHRLRSHTEVIVAHLHNSALDGGAIRLPRDNTKYGASIGIGWIDDSVDLQVFCKLLISTYTRLVYSDPASI